jgi:hypothetical protein
MNRWVDVAYRQACKKIAREKSERATFCIASITQWGEIFFEVIFLFFSNFFLRKTCLFFHYRIYTERRGKRGEFKGINQNRTSCSLMRGPSLIEENFEPSNLWWAGLVISILLHCR